MDKHDARVYYYPDSQGYRDGRHDSQSSFALTAANHTLKYTKVFGPEHLDVGLNTGVLTWTPTPAERGNNSVLLRVDDQHGSYGYQEFVISVTDPVPNRPPPWTSTPVTDARLQGGLPPRGDNKQIESGNLTAALDVQ